MSRQYSGDLLCEITADIGYPTLSIGKLNGKLPVIIRFLLPFQSFLLGFRMGTLGKTPIKSIYFFRFCLRGLRLSMATPSDKTNADLTPKSTPTVFSLRILST